MCNVKNFFFLYINFNLEFAFVITDLAMVSPDRHLSNIAPSYLTEFDGVIDTPLQETFY